ncbi:MAG: DNA gyrase subunit A, partial [uncultured Gemmatimonadetes bacterium]
GDPHPHAARPRSPAADRAGDARVVHRLLDERHRAARASRRARRPEAGASPHPVRHARGGAHPRPPVQEGGDRRGRRAGQVPPARRRLGLRCARPHGAGLFPALPAGGRAGQLRLHRRRRGGGLPLHRGAPFPHRRRAAGRHRPRHRRLRPQLRRPPQGAARPPRAPPQPAGQRLQRHRGGDEHQHPPAQHRRGGARRHPPAGPPRVHRRGADGARPGARLPHRRADRGEAGDPRGVRDGARARGDARPRLQGAEAERKGAARRHRDPVRHQQVAHHRADRGAHARRQGRRHLRSARRERPRGDPRRHRAEARRRRRQGDGPALQVDGAADHLRRDLAGAGQRRAARVLAQGDPGALPRPPHRGRGPPLRLGAGQGARRGAHPSRPAGGAQEDRRGGRHHPRLAQPRHGGEEAGKGPEAGRAAGRGHPQHAP